MKDNYYFDNAATTWPKPEPVYRFMDSFFRSHGVNPGRSGSELALEAEQMIFSTRRMLAEFFGFSGDPNRVVFTLNATDSLNMALRGLLQQGDHLVISALEHNAVLRTANHLERDFGVAVSRVAPDANGYIDPAQFESAITPATKAIVLNHASNVAGTVQNIQSVAEVANRHGAAFIVDTAQTAGVLPVDMSCGIDVLTFTGHKGLYGPMGIGGMIVG
jgi:selenocysteine lyase/cysteine desulfurase